MRKSFLEWLQAYVIYSGIVGVAQGVLGILAFGGTLSVVFGNTAVKAGALVAAMLGTLGLLALLSYNRLEWRNRAELHRNLLNHYCTIICERFKHEWRVRSWKEVVVVERNGDALDKITLSAVVECETLDFFKIYVGPKWPQPERYRSRVRTKVRTLEVEGAGGTRRETTTAWLSDGKLEITVHFGEPAVKGDEINMVVEIDWPGKCAPLMRGNTADEFVVKFMRPIDHFEYVVVLPVGYSAYYDAIGLTRGRDDYTCANHNSETKNAQVRLVARNIDADRSFGLRLDLKPRNAHP